MTASASVFANSKIRSDSNIDDTDTQSSTFLMQKQMQLISSPHSDLKCDSYEASLDAERESDSDTVENESRVEYFSEGKNGTDVSQPQKASSIVEDSIRKDIICTMFDLPTSTTFYPGSILILCVVNCIQTHGMFRLFLRFIGYFCHARTYVSDQ